MSLGFGIEIAIVVPLIWISHHCAQRMIVGKSAGIIRIRLEFHTLYVGVACIRPACAVKWISSVECIRRTALCEEWRGTNDMPHFQRFPVKSPHKTCTVNLVAVVIVITVECWIGRCSVWSRRWSSEPLVIAYICPALGWRSHKSSGNHLILTCICLRICLAVVYSWRELKILTYFGNHVSSGTESVEPCSDTDTAVLSVTDRAYVIEQIISSVNSQIIVLPECRTETFSRPVVVFKNKGFGRIQRVNTRLPSCRHRFSRLQIACGINWSGCVSCRISVAIVKILVRRRSRRPTVSHQWNSDLCRQIIDHSLNILMSEWSLECDSHTSGGAFFGSDKHDTVGSPWTVNCRRSCIFQNFNWFYIIGIDTLHATFDTVNKNERLVILGYWRTASYDKGCLCARWIVCIVNTHTGNLPFKTLACRVYRRAFESGTVDRCYWRCHGALWLSSVTYNNNLVKRVLWDFKLHLKRFLTCYFYTFCGITHIWEHKRLPVWDLNIEDAVHICGPTPLGSFNKNRDSRQSLAGFIKHHTFQVVRFCHCGNRER